MRIKPGVPAPDGAKEVALIDRAPGTTGDTASADVASSIVASKAPITWLSVAATGQELVAVTVITPPVYVAALVALLKSMVMV